MAITGTKYAITNEKRTLFAYIDSGHVDFDEKMPRRSGTADTLAKAKALLARFQEMRVKNAERDIMYAKELMKTTPRTTRSGRAPIWAHEYAKRSRAQGRKILAKAKRAKNTKFNIVRICVTRV